MHLSRTSFVRQYSILFRKWGVFMCQKSRKTTLTKQAEEDFLAEKQRLYMEIGC